MRTNRSMLFVLLSALFIATASALETFDVYDNLKSPSEFVQRGVVRVDDDGTTTYQTVGLQYPPVLPDVNETLTNSKFMTTVILQGTKRYELPILRCRLNGLDKIENTFIFHESLGGEIFHIDYSAGKGENCNSQDSATVSEVTAKVELKKQANGPTPKLTPVASIDAATGKEKKPEEQKSFFARYWYYLVPLLIILMIGGEDPQQEGNNRR